MLNVNYSLEAAASGSILAGQPAPVYYQVEYPEDMDVYGLSFATNIGVVAWSGEISYKKDMPVGIKGTTLLTAALGVLGSQGSLCGTPFSALFYGQFGDRACAAFFDFAVNPTERDHVAQGWDRFDVTQAQSTALYFWDQGLGSQRVTLIGEVAWIYVNDLPPILEMPYGRNPIFGAPTNILDSTTFQPVGFSDEGFVTTNSWGYRIRAAADYPNAFAGVTLTPTLAWAHDVKGTSPTPTFSEGNKALSLGLNFSYLSKYRAGISYTMFTGCVANPTEDRDFLSITFALDF